MSISKQKSDDHYHHGDLRNALIQAGVELLQDEGMDKLSLRKLARKVGVSHNAPYMHFKDKEGLLAAITEEGFNLLAANLRQVLADAGDDWYTRFEVGCLGYVEFVLAHPGHVEVMFRYYDPEVYPDASTAALQALQILVDTISDGQQQGLAAPQDSRYWATLTWSMLHGVAMMFNSGKIPYPMLRGNPPSWLVKDFLKMFYTGLAPRTEQ